MTMIFHEKLKCAVCGKTSEHEIILSTNTMGPPDLDFRPSEMERSTMDKWVQRCPHCGYCASSIDEETDIAADYIKSKEYVELSRNTSYPELARDFLCCSFLEEKAGKFAEAGLSALYAAWACDDAGSTDRAVDCRGRAYEMFLRAREAGQEFVEEAGGEQALMADILRRCGRFEEAIKLCEEGLRGEPDDLVRSMLEYEVKLAEKGDMLCHNVAEILPP